MYQNQTSYEGINEEHNYSLQHHCKIIGVHGNKNNKTKRFVYPQTFYNNDFVF